MKQVIGTIIVMVIVGLAVRYLYDKAQGNKCLCQRTVEALS